MGAALQAANRGSSYNALTFRPALLPMRLAPLPASLPSSASSRSASRSSRSPSLAWPTLPSLEALTDYQPKLPLRVLPPTARLIGEFGEERRNLTPIEDVPKVMKDAVLAIEDARFYEHSGVDYMGMLRAAWPTSRPRKGQGASTITMQVARNVYLSEREDLHPQDLRDPADLQA